MRDNLVFTFVLLIFSVFFDFSNVRAQNGIFITGAVEGSGLGKHYTFQSQGNILSKNWIGSKTKNDFDVLYNPEVELHYHFMNHFGVSLGARFTDKAIVIHDNAYMHSHGINGVDYSEANHGGMRADSGNFNPNAWYFSPNLAVKYIFGKRDFTSVPYVSFGVAYNTLWRKETTMIGAFTDPSSGEELALNVDFKPAVFSQFLEVGWLLYPDYILTLDGPKTEPNQTTRGAQLSVSLRYTFMGNFLNANYTNTKSNMIQYSDRVAAKGNYFGVVFKAGGSIFGNAIDKGYQRKFDKEQEPKQLQKTEPRLLSDSLSEPQEVEGRDIQVRQEIEVKSNLVTISVRDHLKYDKDIISLNLNDEWILQDYTLQLKEKVLVPTNVNTLNYLILYAISEGTEKPCTVAIVIDDGVSKQEVILNSTLDNCEALRIKVKK